MYIRASILLIVFLSFQSSSAWARLGETEKENTARYGKPVYFAPDKTHPILPCAAHLSYKYKGWLIRIAFLEKKATRINYSKTDHLKATPRITDDESTAILKGEAGKGTWKIQKKLILHPLKSVFHRIQHPKEWIHTSGNLAYLQTSSMQLVVETPTVDALLKKQATQAEAARKKNIPTF